MSIWGSKSTYYVHLNLEYPTWTPAQDMNIHRGYKTPNMNVIFALTLILALTLTPMLSFRKNIPDGDPVRIQHSR